MEAAYKLATQTLKGRLIAPYQREGVMWLLYREIEDPVVRGGFLCDEMGLGKTVQIISTILGNPQNKTLIVVPKSIVNQWVEEIEKFAPHLKVRVHEGPKRTKDPADFDGYDITIAPYSVMVTRKKRVSEPTVLHHVAWDRVILDEGHEIRNSGSKISHSIKDLKSKIRWVLTGTPVYNSIKDFVSLCQFLGIPKNYVLGMKTKVKDTYIIRRTKEDVALYNSRLKLPPCDFENVELDMYEEEGKLYQDVFRNCQKTVRKIFKTSENLGAHTMEILECMLRCRQAMIHPQIYMYGIAKKEDLECPEMWEHKSRKHEYLLDSIMTHPSEKSLVFSQFVSEMDLLQESLMERDVSVFRIDGSVSQEDRIRAIREFRKCTNQCVFLIQIKAGGQGLNLQEATRVYITSPSWNPATELQAIGRSHRTGQTKKVIVKKLMYNGFDDLPSIEHSVMSLQGTKSIVCSQVLNDERIIDQIPVKLKNMDKITIRDLKKIFQV